ncbi:MAG: cyclic nucleotide-binding domain-containing protein [Verrucomicrobiae bacterium]|nr:cyclic nucleotide-binding domain-containing protein [Verrucomicrobiae bacterium]
MSIEVRHAERRDSEPIRDLFSEVYGPNSPFGSFFSYNCLILVAEVDGQLAGCISVVISEKSPLRPIYEEAWLAVRPAYQESLASEISNLFRELAQQYELPDANETLRRIDKAFADLRMEVAIVKLLRDLLIFKGLNELELKHLSKLFKQKLFRQGEPVFEEGAVNDELYVIMRGKIDVIIDGAKKIKIATLSAGSVFGEIAFLNQSPRTATTTAAENSIVLIIQRQNFDKLVETQSHLGMIVFRNLALDLSRKLIQQNKTVQMGPPK